MLDKGEVMTTLSQAETNSIGFPIKKKTLFKSGKRRITIVFD